MARLGRGQPGDRTGHSTLRPPTVVGAAAAPYDAPRIKTRLAEESRNQIAAGRRATHYELRPPTVTFDAVVWHGPGVKLAPPLTRGDLERRGSAWELRPPTVVGPANIFGPVDTSLADHPRQGRLPHSTLAPPEVVGEAVAAEVFLGPKVELAKAKPGDPRRATEYDVAAPTIVFPGGQQLGGRGTSLADARNARSDGRRAPHSKLSDPAVVGAAVAPFTADPLRVARAEHHRPAATRSELRQPTVLDPAIIYPGPRASLAEHHRPAPTHPKLRAPTVLGAAVIFRPVQSQLAPSHRPAPTRTELRPPTVITPVLHPIDVSLAEHHRPAAVRFELRAPTVLSPANIYGPVAVEFAKVRQSRPVGHTELAPPTVLGPANIFPAVRLALAEARKPRLVQSELRPPTVIDQPAQPPVDTKAEVSLAPSRDVARRLPKSALRAPEVVAPAVVYPSVATTLAQHSRQGRAPHSELRTPPVAAPIVVYTGPRVSLAEHHRPAPTQASLRAPSVVDPVQTYPSVTTLFAQHSRLGRVSRYELRAPTVVFPFIAPAVAVTLRVTGREIGIRRPVHPRLRPPTDVTQPSDVIYIDYYDHPKPRGILGSSPREDTYDEATAPSVSSAPDVDGFDTPKPIGGFD